MEIRSGVDLSRIPTGRRRRHEALVEAFGSFMVESRNKAIAHIEARLDESDRTRLPRLVREAYASAAEKLGPVRTEVRFLLGKAIDVFAQSLLGMLATTGEDFRVGESLFAQFDLRMRVHADDEPEVPTFDEPIPGEDSERFLPEYWPRWVARYGDKLLPTEK